MTFVVQSKGTSAGASSADCVIVKPTGLTVGDIMIAHCGWGNRTSPTAVTPPSGWTEIHFTAQGNSVIGYSAWKIADSSDVAASDFTFSVNGSGTPVGKGNILRINGGRETTIAAVNAEASAAASSAVSVGTVTPAEADSFLLFLVTGGTPSAAMSASGYAIATDDPTWNEEYDDNYDGGANTVNISCATATRPETSATGNWTATMSATENWVGHVFVIYPQIEINETETVTGTDATPVMGLSITQLETATLVDSSEETVGKYRNNAKSAASWVNPDKS